MVYHSVVVGDLKEWFDAKLVESLFCLEKWEIMFSLLVDNKGKTEPCFVSVYTENIHNSVALDAWFSAHTENGLEIHRALPTLVGIPLTMHIFFLIRL